MGNKWQNDDQALSSRERNISSAIDRINGFLSAQQTENRYRLIPLPKSDFETQYRIERFSPESKQWMGILLITFPRRFGITEGVSPTFVMLPFDPSSSDKRMDSGIQHILSSQEFSQRSMTIKEIRSHPQQPADKSNLVSQQESTAQAPEVETQKLANSQPKQDTLSEADRYSSQTASSQPSSSHGESPTGYGMLDQQFSSEYTHQSDTPLTDNNSKPLFIAKAPRTRQVPKKPMPSIYRNTYEPVLTYHISKQYYSSYSNYGYSPRYRLRLLILDSALQTISQHAISDPYNERFGILIGGVFYDDTYDEYGVDIFDMIPAEEVSANAASVHVNSDEINRINNKIDDVLDKSGGSLRKLGWYHTHPGHGIFMSPTDLANQKRCYRSAWNIAMVVDPQRKEYGVFYGPSAIPLEESNVKEISEVDASNANSEAYRAWKLVASGQKKNLQPSSSSTNEQKATEAPRYPLTSTDLTPSNIQDNLNTPSPPMIENEEISSLAESESTLEATTTLAASEVSLEVPAGQISSSTESETALEEPADITDPEAPAATTVPEVPAEQISSSTESETALEEPATTTGSQTPLEELSIANATSPADLNVPVGLVPSQEANPSDDPKLTAGSPSREGGSIKERWLQKMQGVPVLSLVAFSFVQKVGTEQVSRVLSRALSYTSGRAVSFKDFVRRAVTLPVTRVTVGVISSMLLGILITMLPWFFHLPQFYAWLCASLAVLLVTSINWSLFRLLPNQRQPPHSQAVSSQSSRYDETFFQKLQDIVQVLDAQSESLKALQQDYALLNGLREKSEMDKSEN